MNDGKSTPRADTLKRAINPLEFYQAELPNLPTPKGGAWINEISCPFHSEGSPSFGVNIETGGFHCFGCGEKGGSVVDFTMQRYGLEFDEARRKLAADWSIEAAQSPAALQARSTPPPKNPPKADPAKKPILPIPAQADSLPAHPRHGKASATWTYKDPEGNPLFHVCRFDPTKGRKQILPLTWTAAGWQWRALPPPRPLYHLDKLATHPEALVLVCEGEKAADAAAELMPEAVTTTPPNGARSPGKTDWSPLKGRRVRIWPDADEPGKDFAREAATLARQAGVVAVELLDMDSLARNPATGEPRALGKGWDAADALAEGWTPEALATAARWNPAEPPALELPPGFELRADGLWWRDPSPKAKSTSEHWICSPLRILAYTRDPDGGNWGRLLEFEDPDGAAHRWAMPTALLRGSGEELRGELLRQGVEISTDSKARRLLGDYLQQTKPDARARCVTRTGWFGNVFVLPDRTLGEAVEKVVYQTETLEGARFGSAGTLADWRDNVVALCVGNSRLCFAVAAGFASVLLELAGEEGGGFHFRGASSTGKTRTLLMAASVFGAPGFMQRWRATDNGLEALAEAHNHCLLVLDELAQLEPKIAGETAYMLSNGSGKARADRGGGARAVRRWQLLFLSAGEIGLAEHMAQAGRKVRAGQEARMADISADTGKFGLFENLHGLSDGAAFARHLAEVTAANYGTAGPAFIEAVIPRREALALELKRLRKQFTAEALAGHENPSGQAERVAARFALVAAAGELATACGITGWPKGEAVRSARACFDAWITARGGAGNLEEEALLAQVRAFIELNGEARFTPWDRAPEPTESDRTPRTSNRAGFVRQLDGGLTYYIFPEVFRTEVCAGFDRREAAAVLVRHSWLIPDSDGNPTRKERLPLMQKTQRVYVLPAENMEPEGTTEDAAVGF